MQRLRHLLPIISVRRVAWGAAHHHTYNIFSPVRVWTQPGTSSGLSTVKRVSAVVLLLVSLHTGPVCNWIHVSTEQHTDTHSVSGEHQVSVTAAQFGLRIRPSTDTWKTWGDSASYSMLVCVLLLHEFIQNIWNTSAYIFIPGAASRPLCVVFIKETLSGFGRDMNSWTRIWCHVSLSHKLGSDVWSSFSFTSSGPTL